MPAARVHIDAHDVSIKTPYDPDFVDLLKELIPGRHRRWLPQYKVWEVDALYEREALQAVSEFFDPVHIERDEPAPVPPPAKRPDGGDSDLKLLGLAPDPPLLLVELAYKAQMRLWHPDVNRSPEATARTQQINAAYQRVKARVTRV